MATTNLQGSNKGHWMANAMRWVRRKIEQTLGWLRLLSLSLSQSYPMFNQTCFTFHRFNLRAPHLKSCRGTSELRSVKSTCVDGCTSLRASNNIEPPSDPKWDSVKRWSFSNCWIALKKKCEWIARKNRPGLTEFYLFTDSNDHRNPASSRVAPTRQSSRRFTASTTSWWPIASSISWGSVALFTVTVNRVACLFSTWWRRWPCVMNTKMRWAVKRSSRLNTFWHFPFFTHSPLINLSIQPSQRKQRKCLVNASRNPRRRWTRRNRRWFKGKWRWSSIRTKFKGNRWRSRRFRSKKSSRNITNSSTTTVETCWLRRSHRTAASRVQATIIWSKIWWQSAKTATKVLRIPAWVDWARTSWCRMMLSVSIWKVPTSWRRCWVRWKPTHLTICWPVSNRKK